MIREELIRGNKYRWKDQPDTPDLMYIGKSYGMWHQFTKFSDGRFGVVWCEMRDNDINSLEAIKEQAK